jgi:hypothetical protein
VLNHDVTQSGRRYLETEGQLVASHAVTNSSELDVAEQGKMITQAEFDADAD